jgi:hypothetical protein
MGVNQEEEAGKVVACAAVVCVDVTLLLLVVGHERELLMSQLLSLC